MLDWIGDLDLAQVQANELKSDFELADGVRHSLNSQLMQRFLKPLHKNIVNLAKKRKKDIEWTKKALGIWVSANYSVQKNQELLARDEQAMIEAKQAFDDAKANGTNAEIDKATTGKSMRKASLSSRVKWAWQVSLFRTPKP